MGGCGSKAPVPDTVEAVASPAKQEPPNIQQPPAAAPEPAATAAASPAPTAGIAQEQVAVTVVAAPAPVTAAASVIVESTPATKSEPVVVKASSAAVIAAPVAAPTAAEEAAPSTEEESPAEPEPRRSFFESIGDAFSRSARRLSAAIFTAEEMSLADTDAEALEALVRRLEGLAGISAPPKVPEAADTEEDAAATLTDAQLGELEALVEKLEKKAA